MKSPTELATEQAAFWNGPGGQGWLAAYRRIERSIAPFSAELLAAAAAQPGEHVIDVGCGTGATTSELARAVGPTGHVLGVDISETLVEAARAHRVDNATFVVADAGPAPIDKAKAAIAAALEPHLGPDGVALPGACWLVSAGLRR